VYKLNIGTNHKNFNRIFVKFISTFVLIKSVFTHRQVQTLARADINLTNVDDFFLKMSFMQLDRIGLSSIKLEETRDPEIGLNSVKNAEKTSQNLFRAMSQSG
jgi:hypothetical protein